MRFEVQEDSGDDRRVGEEGEDPHLSAATGTEQRQYTINTGEERGPADAGPFGGWGRSIIPRCAVPEDRVGDLSLRSLDVRPTDRYDGSTEFRVRGKDAVVAMPVHAGWRNESSQPLQ